MDEGRLKVVFRQEEQNRKYVYMMNYMVRARLSLYSNCLAREQREAAVKLVKRCIEVRRVIVRQSVLSKCLHKRKQKMLALHPESYYGQYGGKPLWAMSRDIDRVIAENHPRLRRLKRVQEALHQSFNSGAILDEDTVAHRMDALFQLLQNPKQQEKISARPETLLARQKGGLKLPPLFSRCNNSGLLSPSKQSRRCDQKTATLKERFTLQTDKPITDPEKIAADCLAEEVWKNLASVESRKVYPQSNHSGRQITPSGSAEKRRDERGDLSRNIARLCLKDREVGSGQENGGRKLRTREEEKALEPDAEIDNKDHRPTSDHVPSLNSRSKLILPPIQSSKALVART